MSNNETEQHNKKILTLKKSGVSVVDKNEFIQTGSISKARVVKVVRKNRTGIDVKDSDNDKAMLDEYNKRKKIFEEFETKEYKEKADAKKNENKNIMNALSLNHILQIDENTSAGKDVKLNEETILKNSFDVPVKSEFHDMNALPDDQKHNVRQDSLKKSIHFNSNSNIVEKNALSEKNTEEPIKLKQIKKLIPLKKVDVLPVKKIIKSTHGQKSSFSKTQPDLVVDAKSWHIDNMELEDERVRVRELFNKRQMKKKKKTSKEIVKIVRNVIVPDFILVSDLAQRMAMKSNEVIRAMRDLGIENTGHLDFDSASIIVEYFGHIVEKNNIVTVDSVIAEFDDNDLNMELCPPVVTVMGHVDHGKTSLLDAFRQSSITETEFGGITQSTSAYIVQMRDGRSITFIDTPGHEAFADMRIRGAIVTDIVVLVVAADDGVMPQTIEAIGHVKSAGVPMIVAVNKIDKSGANPKKVLTDLIKYGIVVESLGGNDLAVEISAAQKKNIEELENTILLQAEMIKLKANYNRLANGVVLESRFLPGYGACISCIVKGGTLKKGDIVVSGEFYGIVKSLIVSGKQVDKVTPSMPVDIIGLNGVPSAGEKFVAVKNQKIAKEITANYKVNNKSNEEKNFSSDIDKFFATDKKKEINVLIKADVYGSCDAIVNSINNIKDHEVSINVLYSGVGNVNESDVLLAAVSSAHIIGFNVSTDSRVESIAKSKGVEIKSCRIIYEIIDHIKERVSDLFAPIVNKKYIGSASVRKIFGVNKNIIAGCYVTDGLIKKSSSVDVVRGNEVVLSTKIKSLKRAKEDVSEVNSGFECGIMLDVDDVLEGDLLKMYDVSKQKRVL